MEHKKRVLVPVADGSEEIETVNIVDCLRRAELDVTMASVHKKKSGHNPSIKGSRNIGLLCDSYLEDVID
jgi:4-methyl-5(b-hydroxyethyl)-thiazole monophosphate biosynthesis